MFQSRALKAGFVTLAFGGTILAWSIPAEAGASTGRWRNGMVAGPYGVGYYGYGGYRPAVAGYYRGGHGYYGGYRPTFYGRDYGYRPYYRRRDRGAAVAAGLIGGFALGALAAAPYSYSYPTCYTVRRRYVDDWGRVIVRRTEVCE